MKTQTAWAVVAKHGDIVITGEWLLIFSTKCDAKKMRYKNLGETVEKVVVTRA